MESRSCLQQVARTTAANDNKPYDCRVTHQTRKKGGGGGALPPRVLVLLDCPCVHQYPAPWPDQPAELRQRPQPARLPPDEIGWKRFGLIRAIEIQTVCVCVCVRACVRAFSFVLQPRLQYTFSPKSKLGSHKTRQDCRHPALRTAERASHSFIHSNSFPCNVGVVHKAHNT